MGKKRLYNDTLRKLPNEYGDVSVMWLLIRFSQISDATISELDDVFQLKQCFAILYKIPQTSVHFQVYKTIDNSCNAEMKALLKS